MNIFHSELVSFILSLILTGLDKNTALKKTLVYYVVRTLQICNVFIVQAQDEASLFIFGQIDKSTSHLYEKSASLIRLIS